MFCDPLDIPDEVIAAQEAGELVVFVGAGVSFGGASDLPLFKGLTQQIGATIGKTPDPEREDYDVLLGEWEEHEGVQVHEAARAIIGNPKSRPNEAHSLLLRLFKKPEHIRIVTTNYDRHFTTAAQELGVSLPVYRAPALPLGDDFHGLVFLHGSVDDKPSSLVLTDADFGRAYLSQGWARTFLQTLYSKFHVLFVGYSHGDILLNYLARGLPSRDRRRRHAIQALGFSHRWKSLGIGVIAYELPHSNLDAGLARWVQLSSYRPHEIRDRLRQIIAGVEGTALVLGGENTPKGDVAASPIQLNQDSGWVVSRVLRDKNSTPWFTERASDIRWIPYLYEANHLPALSSDLSLARLTDVQGQLMGWAVKRLLASHRPEVLSIYAKLGGTVGPNAWWWMVQTFVVGESDTRLWDSPFLHHWLVAIRQGCDARYDYDLIGSLVRILVSKNQTDHAIGLFEKMIQVRVVWTTSSTHRHPDGSVVAEAKISTDKHELQDAWEAIEPARTAATNERLFRILTTCVENIYAALGPLSGGFDPVAGMRVLFDEPRTNHDPHDSADLVPVMLLEVLKARGVSAGGIGEQQIQLWLDSPEVGWHRIAIYALRVDDTITPKRKAELILEHGLVYPNGWQVQHDPEVLVSGIFAQITQPLRVKLLEQIVAGPNISPQENRTEEEIARSAEGIRNGFLVRLALAHRDDPDVSAVMLRLGMKPPESNDLDLELNPGDFAARQVRDLERSPQTVDELLEKTPESQLDYFLGYQGEGDAWAGPNRTGLHGNVVKAANQNLEWARGLIGALISRGQPEGDLWDRLVWGLTWHTKEPEFRRWLLIEIMPQVDPSAWTVDVWRGWSHHLFSLGESKTFEGLSPEEWAVLVSWSVRAWDATHLTPGGDEGNDKITKALSRAINHPAGRAVDFWMTYLSHLRRSDPSTPHVWPDQLQPRIAALMAMDSDMRLMGLAVFGQNLSFVRYALPEWTKATLYPLLIEKASLGICLWTTWLHYGRLSAELATDLPPLFESAHANLLKGGKNTPRRFMSYLAVLAVGPLAPKDCARWVRDILRNATPEQRSWWIEEVSRSVGDLATERQVEVWNRWAKAHLDACVLGQFGVLSAAEFEEFLHWPIAFYAVGDEVLNQIRRFPVQTVKRLGGIHDLKRSGLAKEIPDFVARYLRWLLAEVTAERYGYYGVADIISEITATAVNVEDLHAISASLLSLGYPKEAEALDEKLREFATPETKEAAI